MKRRGWLVMVVVLLIAGAIWVATSPDDEPSPAAPSGLAGVEALPASADAWIAEGPGPEVEPVDAGEQEEERPAVAAPEATAPKPGGWTTTPPEGFDLQAYVARWRDALKQLTGKNAVSPRGLRSAHDGVAGRGVETTDAGAAPACAPGRVQRPLIAATQLDVFVFVDTSGSMMDLLDDVADWLGRLELLLREAQRDYQLIVVADRSALFSARRPPPKDGGVLDQLIRSHDIFDVLLRTGETTNGWRTLTRSGVPTELVLITDDSPWARYDARGYAARFSRLLGPTVVTTRLHLIGGFEVGQPLLLGPDAPISRAVCRPHGVAPGLEYQALATANRGLRASLCERPSREALLKQLLEVRSPTTGCEWELPLHEDAEIVDPAIVDARGLREPLLQEYSAAACAGLRRSYLARPRGLTLCPSTCEAVRADNFVALELSWTCRR